MTNNNNEKFAKFAAYTDSEQNGESADTEVDLYQSYDAAQLISFTSDNRRAGSTNSVAYLNRTLSYASYDSTARILSISASDGSQMQLTDVYENQKIGVTFDGHTRNSVKVGTRVTLDYSPATLYYGFDFNSELIGGRGRNSFNVSKQVGDVSIISQNAADNVNLYDVTLADIMDIAITPSSYGGSTSETMSLTFATGKTVSITGDAQNFNLADSSYVYSRAERTLTQTA